MNTVGFQVRLHCFFYLLPVARGGVFVSGLDSQEPDPQVLKLIKDLATIDDALTNTLQPRKCKVGTGISLFTLSFPIQMKFQCLIPYDYAVPKSIIILITYGFHFGIFAVHI